MSARRPPEEREPPRLSIARAARVASNMRTLRAIAAGLRGGHYGVSEHWPEQNEGLARYFDAQADDSLAKLRRFEAQGGFERVRARHGGTK